MNDLIKQKLIAALTRFAATPAPNYPIEGYIGANKTEIESVRDLVIQEDGEPLTELCRTILGLIPGVELSDEDNTQDQLRYYYAVSKVRESAQQVLQDAPANELETLFVKRKDHEEDFARILSGLESIKSEFAKFNAETSRNALDGFSVNIGPIGVPLSSVLVTAQQASLTIASMSGIDAVALSITLKSLSTNASMALRVALGIDGLSASALKSLRAIKEAAAGTVVASLRILKSAMKVLSEAGQATAAATIPVGNGRRFGWASEAFAVDLGSSAFRLVKSDSAVSEVPTMPPGLGKLTRLGWLDRVGYSHRAVIDGVLADPTGAAAILSDVWSASKIRGGLSKHPLTAAVPHAATPVQRRALSRLLKSKLPASPVRLVDAPIAAARGAGLNISGGDAILIVDFGAGKTEISVLAFNGVVVSQLVKSGGDEMSIAVKDAVHRSTNLFLGMDVCEALKLRFGLSADIDIDRGKGPSTIITGFHSFMKVPKSLPIEERLITTSITYVALNIIESIKKVIESTPPELASSIQDNGIYLSGGGSKLSGFDKMVRDYTGFKVTIVDEPELAVARGLSLVLNSAI